jgi:predicted amidohydrolase
MQDLRIAAVSTQNWIGQPGRALMRMEEWVRKARAKDAEFIVFPELNINGYFHSTHTLAVAEPIPGPSTDAVIDMAARHNAILCFGILENDCDVVYNTQVVVDGNGILGTQRKIHMPGIEYLYWRSGFDIGVIDIGKARVGIAICADATYMELIRTLYYRGAEVLVMPFAYDTPGPRSNLPWRDVGLMSYRVNCFSNGMYGVLCNNAGTRRATKQEGSKARFPGWAGVFDPLGEVVTWTKGKGNGEAMVVSDLKAQALYDRRRCEYFAPRTLMPSRYATIWESESPLTQDGGAAPHTGHARFLPKGR